MLKAFADQKARMPSLIDVIITSYQLPFSEDLDTLNPVMQLHGVNLDFLVTTSKNIIKSPQNLVPGLSEINGDEVLKLKSSTAFPPLTQMSTEAAAASAEL